MVCVLLVRGELSGIHHSIAKVSSLKIISKIQLDCSIECATCTSLTQCQTCNSGYGKISGGTVCITCPDGTFLQGSTCASKIHSISFPHSFRL